ncbi:SDR family NAD(P)-dependent oxidoreductase [Halobacillus litoralis]|uniref:SDR family NAD(P)-dependent oxidoreductase n=1 Tax=Halobacillus litoralis TaxID=45668 RepID=A0A845DVK1_9BACI|nr:SDR family NAD(P)-dependent oxidoreductase [Halobacillus litoralis]MYL30025.1 SDR family NAD(P)-dependent oxidoreductase [Halobacillus halophilus]MYL37512.1 SDR family NAD(P)-dependent oxidoreductase [Halobacillus litoralis]
MFYKDKGILVIGGTGTIGKRIVTALLKESPKYIKVLSRDEYKQYQMEKEIKSDTRVRFILGDIRHYETVYDAMADVDYVFHLAAMKHVPFCENNPYEAVLTNIAGTRHVVRAAKARRVKKVVFTSTDKAISPTNTYGASKLIAERLLLSSDQNKSEGDTIFASVRFGNVMGSRGSVIPLFVKQMVEKKRITVTDDRMSRFMMTIDEAASLTIRSLTRAQGGEIFVLKMPVISLQDLIEVVREEVCIKYGLNPCDITVQEIGLRAGEKMYEELMTFEESTTAWEFDDMYVIPGETQRTYPDAVRAQVRTYSSSDQNPVSKEDLRRIVQKQNLI